MGLTSGALLMGAAAARAAQAALGVRARARRQETAARSRREKFAAQLAAAVGWARASDPRLRAWTGLRTMRVTRVVDECRDCRSLYLAPVDGRPLPRFAPGQYLTFHLETDRQSAPVVRCYSLSDRPRDDVYRVTVKRALPPGRRLDVPLGRASNFLHDRVGQGSLVQIEAPQGAFFLDMGDPLPVALIGGGIGVTPLVSMAAALTHAADPRRVVFFGGFRNGDSHPFREELQAMAANHDQLELDISYSKPTERDRQQGLHHHVGRITLERLRSVLPSGNFRFFVCGPPGMMAGLVPELRAWGVPPKHLHFEAFGPASVPLDRDVPCAPVEIEFARSQRTATWTGSEPSLLALAEAAGVPIESGCRAGNCGQCRVRLLAGDVDHAKPPGVELVDGECLACVARPRGRVRVDA